MAATTPSAPDRGSVLPDDTLIVGGTGLLGRALTARSGRSTAATWHHTRPDRTTSVEWIALDLLDDSTATRRLIEGRRPAVIINAAYARAGAELGAVTGRAPGDLAAVARHVDARFVHLSTDVVFAGDREAPYVESDRPDPVHDYGRAKAAAEAAVLAAAPDSLVVRTSLLYGSAAGEQERLVAQAAAGAMAFFTDEIRCPVHVDDLASAITDLAASPIAGLVHLGGADAVDRLTFARLLAPSVGVDPDVLSGAISDPALDRPRRVVLATERTDLGALSPLPGCRSRLG